MSTVLNYPDSDEGAQVQCMEVWGGNGAAQNSFRRPGIDLWVWSQPQGPPEVVGGDVHFVSSCASGRITRMLIADVCARGKVYVDLASDLRELMMHNVNRIKQTKLLRDMNTKLQKFAGEGAYATAVIATYFAATKSFSLCNTGQPPPLLFRAKQQKWSTLKQPPMEVPDPERLVDGLVDTAEYQNFEVRLEKHDLVLCYSNTLTECRDWDGQYLGVDGLLNRVSDLDPTRPGELVPKLVAQVTAEHPENLTEHDGTVMLCQATETGVGWRNNLLAPFRLFGKVGDKTNI